MLGRCDREEGAGAEYLEHLLAVYRYYGNGDQEVEIDPKNSLGRDARYTVKVTTGVNDGANNLEAPHSRSFKTRR